jgi:uncharacterized protein involved in exopolysaccharide biosynthesis
MSDGLTQRQRESSDIDLRTLLRLVWERRLLVMVIVAGFAGAAAAASFLITPIYRATTVAVPVEVDKGALGFDSALSQFGGLAALAGISLDSASTAVEETLAVLRSRRFTEEFIRDKDLLHILFTEEQLLEEDGPGLFEAYRIFNQEVRVVSRDTRSGLVSIQIEWKDPVLAAEWANTLVGRINTEMQNRAITEANESLGFLERELSTTTIVDTRDAIGRLIESQVNQRMLANVTEEYALRVVDEALPPDIDDPVRPQRLFLAAISGAVGLMVAILICVVARRPE